MRAHHLARAALSLTLLVCLLLTGCQPDERPHLIFLVVEDEQGYYWENLIEGATVAAQDNGWLLHIALYDPEAGLDPLIAQAEGFNADYLALALNRHNLPDSYPDTLPLILLGSDALSDDASILVSGEETTIGKRTGQLCAWAIGLQKRMMLLTTTPSLDPADDWEIALRGELGFQGSLVSARVNCEDDENEAYLQCRQLLSSTSPPDGIICRTESATQGALRAVRSLGLQIPIIGTDFNDEIALGLRDGLVRLTVVRSAFAYGYMGVENAIRLSNGRYSGLETTKLLDAVYVDADNMFDENLLAFLYDIQ